MVHRPLRLSLCALPIVVFLVGDAEALSHLAFPVSGTQGPVTQKAPDVWPPLPGFNGFGVIGAGTCTPVRRQTIESGNRVRSRTFKICN